MYTIKITAILISLIIGCNSNMALKDQPLEEKIKYEKEKYIQSLKKDSTRQKNTTYLIKENPFYNLKFSNELISCNNEKEVKRYKDKSRVSSYNLEDLIKELKKEKVNIKLLEKEKDYFDGYKYLLIVDNVRYTIYDYEELSSLKKDLIMIKREGVNIKGAHLPQNKQIRFYNKGELLLIYCGDDERNINFIMNKLGFSLINT